MEPKTVKLSLPILSRGQPMKNENGEDVTVRDCLLMLLHQPLQTQDAKESMMIHRLCLQISDEAVTEIEIAKKPWDVLEKHLLSNKTARGDQVLLPHVQGQVLVALGFSDDDL